MRARVIALSLGLVACSSDLPPLGEVVVTVDTDAPKPRLAGRLRVDAYTQDGLLYASRDLERPNERDFPASFSVASGDESGERSVLLRLRVYPEGRTRPYRGERPLPAPAVEPVIPQSADALCAQAPSLVLGTSLALDRGANVVLEGRDSCPSRSGSVAAQIHITRAGRYRFRVRAALPDAMVGVAFVPRSVNLSLRTECANPSTELACATPTLGDPARALPVLDVDLAPGDYFLVTGSTNPLEPATIVLHGDVAEAPDPGAWTPTLASAEAEPSLVEAAPPAKVPAREPEPGVTIDRLVRVRVRAGHVDRVRVHLSTTCFGTPPDLRVRGGRLDVSAARSCVATARVREPIEAIAPGDGPTVASTSAEDAPCLPSDTTDAVVCVPRGIFMLGSIEGQGLDLSAAPERVAVMPRFWIDRYEVTVSDFRARGVRDPRFENPDSRPLTVSPETNDEDRFCPYSENAGERENFGMACISWYTARAYCKHRGGDLPTEAQWEYAAVASGTSGDAGRFVEHRFPWGDEAPSCNDAVFARGVDVRRETIDCVEFGAGPAAVDAGASDRTPGLGIVGMGGGLNEWVLDADEPYDGACWQNAPLVSPRCDSPDSLRRVVRGGAWDAPSDFMRIGYRAARIPGVGATTTGFRCAYDEAPR